MFEAVFVCHVKRVEEKKCVNSLLINLGQEYFDIRRTEKDWKKEISEEEIYKPSAPGQPGEVVLFTSGESSRQEVSLCRHT